MCVCVHVRVHHSLTHSINQSLIHSFIRSLLNPSLQTPPPSSPFHSYRCMSWNLLARTSWSPLMVERSCMTLSTSFRASFLRAELPSFRLTRHSRCGLSRCTQGCTNSQIWSEAVLRPPESTPTTLWKPSARGYSKGRKGWAQEQGQREATACLFVCLLACSGVEVSTMLPAHTYTHVQSDLHMFSCRTRLVKLLCLK